MASLNQSTDMTNPFFPNADVTGSHLLSLSFVWAHVQVVLSCFDLPHTKTLLSGSTVVEQGLLSRIIPSDAASCNYDGTGLTWSARSSLLFPFLASYRSLYNEIETMVDGLVGLVQEILARKGEFIKAFHKHRQEHYRGLSEGFLWHSTCQDNTIGRMWQVHVSAVMTRRTRFFGWTGIQIPVFVQIFNKAALEVESLDSSRWIW